MNLLKPQDWSSLNKLADELGLWGFTRIALFGLEGLLEKIALYGMGRSLSGVLEDRTDQSPCTSQTDQSTFVSKIRAPRTFPNCSMKQNTNAYTMFECKICS